MKINTHVYLLFSAILIVDNAIADQPVVDKIYHPYVLPLEREIEWRFNINERNESLNEESSNISQRFGYGNSISEHITLEGYLIGEKTENLDFVLQAYELELRWMITEQGQYSIDWGMIFEIQKEHQANNWEFKTGVLAETEIGKSSITANIFTIYEYGDGIAEEIDSEFNFQYRYRLKPGFQPGIELYIGKDYLGLGPAFMGIHRFQKKKQLKWSSGLIFGLTNTSSEHTLRFDIEYEF